MSAVNPVNPFTPPRAAVNDVHPQATTFSTPRAWSAKGRLGRLRYLAYSMVGYLLVIVAAGIAGAIAGAAGYVALAAPIGLLVSIPYLVLTVLLLIQRSHDMNWSGWTVLWCLVPLVAFVWLFKAGTPGTNRFGAPPPPNTTGVKVAAFGLLTLVIIGFIGMLAAVSIPAYQAYTERANAVQLPQP